MSAAIKVKLGAPENGWISLGISYANQVTNIDASYTPHDSMTMLVDAIAKLAKGNDNAVVPFVEGPAEYELAFHSAGERVSVTITLYPDHRRMRSTGQQVFEAFGRRREVCLAFWRALRQLESRVSGEDFERNWNHPFPTSKLRVLTRTIKGLDDVSSK